MLRALVFLVLSLVVGSLQSFYALGLLISDAFVDASGLLLTLLLLALGALFVIAILFGSWQPRARRVVALGLSLPWCLLCLLLGTASLASGEHLGVVWLVAAMAVAITCTIGTSTGARLQRVIAR